jgi:hypothetical protein
MVETPQHTSTPYAHLTSQSSARTGILAPAVTHDWPKTVKMGLVFRHITKQTMIPG